jgi:hypothetical protein
MLQFRHFFLACKYLVENPLGVYFIDGMGVEKYSKIPKVRAE